MITKVRLKNVYKTFDFQAKKSEKILNLFSLKRRGNKKFLALNNISFEVYEGETVGFVGLNGSGKSTLSNIISGVIQPTKGDLEVNGETSLISISAGLNGNLTGIENIELKCMMQGLTKERIQEILPDIINFADIGDFINQPVKNYSSGMKSRLGFAISVHIDPDILIIDEALSVGDSTFTQKCLKKMNQFKKEGKTIFFISHSANQMKEFCDRVIWLHYGSIKEIGDSESVINNYQKFIAWFNKLSNDEKREHKNSMMANQIEVLDRVGKGDNESKINTLEILKDCLIVLPVILSGLLLLMGY